MKLTMARHELELDGKYLSWLRDSTELLEDVPAMRTRMDEDGYLLLRGLHDPAKVLAARRHILEQLAGNGQLDPDAPLLDAVPAEGSRGAFMGGQKSVTRARPFLDVVESPEVMGFFARYLEADIRTYDYKWLRVVGPGGFTGAHYDVVYMGRGTKDLYTVWTPLGDVPLEQGPLAILVGSHQFEKVRETYGQMDVDRDKVAGWFSSNPIETVDRHGGRWGTHEFRMGDVLIFGMFTMHASIDNHSNRFRLSCDTRYQRADAPIDERWIGEDPIAHYAWMKGETTPMETMREKWGV